MAVTGDQSGAASSFRIARNSAAVQTQCGSTARSAELRWQLNGRAGERLEIWATSGENEIEGAVFLLALLLAIAPPRDVLLPPVWSPDHQVLATTKINERFLTPEGADYTLFMNGRRVYPPKPKHSFFAAYTNQHTFRSNLTWSPDGQYLAFTEEVYDWHYVDPYNSDFNGYASKKRYLLVLVTRDGKPAGYRLSDIPSGAELRWHGPATVSFAGREFDLRTDPPHKTP